MSNKYQKLFYVKLVCLFVVKYCVEQELENTMIAINNFYKLNIEYKLIFSVFLKKFHIN